MIKLQKEIKTGQEYSLFCQKLIDSVNDNVQISDKPMMDGFIISLIIDSPDFKKLFFNRRMGNISDRMIRKLENMVAWCVNNEDKLLTL